MQTTMSVPVNVLDPESEQFNEMLYTLAVNAVSRGAAVETSEAEMMTTYELSDSFITFERAKTLTSLGVIVKNYPIAIKVVGTDVVPSGIPNADGVITWIDWCLLANPNSYPEDVDGQEYIVISALGYDTLNDFASVINDWVSVKDFLAAKAEANSTPV